MIYLASPYAHDDPLVMRTRFAAVCQIVADYYAKETPVYSPIVHNHPVAEAHSLPRTWDFWSKIDLPMLDLCDTLTVACMPGWKDSVGVNAEIQHAIKRGIDVTFIKLSENGHVSISPPFPYNEALKNTKHVRNNRPQG